ncbi:efflux RND transporter periplasmic adaptor subunit [Desulfonatronovibrio magnus]|uniref:efflux RND transporter periplasmic adaptor subunit n=1 Tax=Desulfonatronovibrio magnus TaxID=698827 RepID=UPI0005EB36D7|nr:efflux RND transporter periplasmic adaptor subunit [Desulfonatronovibrio magnus]
MSIKKFSVFFLLLFCMGCDAQEPREQVLRPVKTMLVPESSTITSIMLPGLVKPVQEVNLAFRVSNQINKLYVQKGDFVEQGQVLARLDERDFSIAVRNISGRLDEARSNLQAMLAGARQEDIRSLEAELDAAMAASDEAHLQYSRIERLYHMGAVAAADLDSARSKRVEATSQVRSLQMELEKARTGARQEEIDAARSLIRSLEANLDEAVSAKKDSVLMAPFSGYISQKYVDNFDLVQAGQSIFNLQDQSSFEVSVNIPEQIMLHKDHIKKVRVVLEAYPALELPAVITEISTDASPVSRTYILNAEFQRPGNLSVYPSMAADVFLHINQPADSLTRIKIPETALVAADDATPLVWVLDPVEDRVFSRKVGTGRISGNKVEIVDGLEPGEIIVIAGAGYLWEGQPVRNLGQD